MTLFGIQTPPTKVKEHWNSLYDYCQELIYFKNDDNNIIILGDLNASGTYLTEKEFMDLKFMKDSSWKWMIKDQLPTVPGQAFQVHDRILVHEKLTEHIPRQGSEFRYIEDWTFDIEGFLSDRCSNVQKKEEDKARSEEISFYCEPSFTLSPSQFRYRTRLSNWSQFLEEELPDVYGPLRIGAFNVKDFGEKFSNHPAKVNILIRILQRYDIVLVQEIRNVDAFQKLMKKLDYSGKKVYEHVISDPVGLEDSSRKEHYAYIYRLNRVREVQNYTQEHKDIARSPFVVEFKWNNLRLVFIGIHTRPHKKEPSVQQELDALYGICQQILPEKKNVIVLGDFNADGEYLGKEEQEKLHFKTDPEWKWMIDYHLATNTSRAKMTYDQILIHKSLTDHFQASGSVFRYIDENISEPKTLISDHFPVELLLRPRKHHDVRPTSFEERHKTFVSERIQCQRKVKIVGVFTTVDALLTALRDQNVGLRYGVRDLIGIVSRDLIVKLVPQNQYPEIVFALMLGEEDVVKVLVPRYKNEENTNALLDQFLHLSI